MLRLQRQHSQLERDLADFRDKAQARELAVLNSMAEGVLLLDPTGRVRLSNRATAEIFGVRYDIRGQTLLEAFHLDSLQEVFRRVLEDGRVVNVELELPSEERRVIQIDATVLLGERGEKEGILLECRDQTRVRQLENTRREFVANVSHELRTPLSLIKGYTETLLHGAKDDPQVAEKFLHTIERHADRLTYLIEDLLIISQLDSRKAVMSVQSFSLAGLVDDDGMPN